MTIDGKLLSETKALFRVPGRDAWWETFPSNQSTQPHDYPKALDSERRRIVVVDVPIQWLYSPGQQEQSLEMFLQRMAAKCQRLLESENVTAVLFLIDKGAPAPKSVFRKADATSTPPTPFNFSTDPMEAWEKWFKTRPFENDDNFGGQSSTSKNNFLFPRTIPPKAERPPTFPKDENYPYYQHCLSNVHFKQFIYRKCCDAMLRLVDVPDNKWLLVSGPNFCRSKEGPTTGNSPQPSKISNPKTGLRYELQEVDTTVGYWAMVLSDHFDVDIDSNDGDSIMCALLATNLRLFPGVQNIESARFRNQVRIIRHHWDQYPTETININELFIHIHMVFSNVCPHIVDPIGTYVALGMLLGNDYVQGLPTVNIETVFKAFLQYHEQIGSLFLEPRESCNRIRLNWEAYQRLVCSVYATYYADLNLNIGSVEVLVRELLRAKKPAVTKVTLSRGIVSVPLLRVRFANLCWCLNYFHSVAYGERWSVDDFETDEAGVSLWGYTRVSNESDSYGQHDIRLAEDANVELLAKNLQHWNEVN